MNTLSVILMIVGGLLMTAQAVTWYRCQFYRSSVFAGLAFVIWLALFLISLK